MLNESDCSEKNHKITLQNEAYSTEMTTDIELKKSEKELCSQTTQYTATSVDSNRYALSIHHKSSKVPCETVVLGPYNQANRMFRYQSRDSQCTINALCSLIFARFLH